MTSQGFSFQGLCGHIESLSPSYSKISITNLYNINAVKELIEGGKRKERQK